MNIVVDYCYSSVHLLLFVVFISGRPDGRTCLSVIRRGVHQRAAGRPHCAGLMSPSCIPAQRPNGRRCCGTKLFWIHQHSGLTAAVAAGDGVLVYGRKTLDGLCGCERRRLVGRDGSNMTVAVVAGGDVVMRVREPA